jgi:hypothetical protein
MRGKKTPDRTRAEAVGLALVTGVPAASKALGIPQRTIREWKDDPDFAELRLSAREEVGAAMWVAIQVGLGEVYEGLRNPDERLKDKADAVFGLIEKRALLLGEATSRNENVSITDGLSDDEKRKLREAIGRAASLEAGGDGAGDGVALPSEASPAAS